MTEAPSAEVGARLPKVVGLWKTEKQWPIKTKAIGDLLMPVTDH
jgi:hypothetical protein